MNILWGLIVYEIWEGQIKEKIMLFKHIRAREPVILIMLFFIIISGCGVSRQTVELGTNAEEAFEAGNFKEALVYYDELIELKRSRGQTVDGITFYNAGISAWETGQTPGAIQYLGRAHDQGSFTGKSYYILSVAYREIDNLSLEITSLEAYRELFPSGEWIDEAQARLFEVYIESGNYEGAMELWTVVGADAANDPELLEQYFILNQQLGFDEKLDDITESLLDLDSDNKFALKYLAEKIFWEAEDLYQKEMQAYENEQTRRQYRQLLNALENINEMFRTARDYFERLYALEPAPEYARYLMNIYLRFGNEERAEFYRRETQPEQ
jgi:tetratricopeptide (TPR) repeat protein